MWNSGPFLILGSTQTPSQDSLANFTYLNTHFIQSTSSSYFDHLVIPWLKLRVLFLLILLCSVNSLLWGQIYTDTYYDSYIDATYSVTNGGSDLYLDISWSGYFEATDDGCDQHEDARKLHFRTYSNNVYTTLWSISNYPSGSNNFPNPIFSSLDRSTGDFIVGPGFAKDVYIYATADGCNNSVIGCVIDCNASHVSTNSLEARTAFLKNPVNVKASATEAEGSTFSSMEITWEKGTDFPDSWVNYRILGPNPAANNYSKVYGIVNGSTRSFTVTGLEPGKSYSFIVETSSTTTLRPVNYHGWGNVNSYGVFGHGSTLGTNPTASQGTYNNKIKLNWNSFSSLVDNFRLMRSIPTFEGGGFEEIAILNKHAQSYIDTDAIPGYSYTYQVIPLDANGDILETPIPEASGWMRPNGIIKGRVLSLGGTGVQGVTITVEEASPGLPANKGPASSGYSGPYTVQTDIDGYY